MKKFKDMSRKKKMFILPLFAILVIGSVFATTSYIVNNFTIETDVYEPFNVSYHIIGDAGNYDGNTLCNDIDSSQYVQIADGDVVDVDGLYAGESRKFCVLIDNAGAGDIDYTIESNVVSGLGNLQDCEAAFPETTKTGTATGEQITIDGEVIDVPSNAPPVEDCNLEVSVSRG